MQEENHIDTEILNKVDNYVPDQRFYLGLAGAVVAGAIGMTVWYYLILITNYELGIVAWGIGALTGYAAVLLARTGTQKLGICAAIIAASAIVAGQFVFTYDMFEKQLDEIVQTWYDEEVEFGKRVEAATTDESVRQLVAELKCEDEDEKPDYTAVTEEEITRFNEEIKTNYLELANGIITREEYIRNVKANIKDEVSFREILAGSVSLFTILWIFLGVGSAYKIASRKGHNI
jgi:hypothetical protein